MWDYIFSSGYGSADCLTEEIFNLSNSLMNNLCDYYEKEHESK